VATLGHELSHSFIYQNSKPPGLRGLFYKHQSAKEEEVAAEVVGESIQKRLFGTGDVQQALKTWIQKTKTDPAYKNLPNHNNAFEILRDHLGVRGLPVIINDF
jgi:hypothetical protein